MVNNKSFLIENINDVYKIIKNSNLIQKYENKNIEVQNVTYSELKVKKMLSLYKSI